MKIAYLVSRFPHPYQPFIRREVGELIRQGLDITVFPVVRGGGQPGPAAPPVRSLPAFSRQRARAWWHFSRRSPGVFLSLCRSLLADTAKDPVNMVKSLFIIPRCLQIALVLREEGFEHIHAHWATHPATAALIASRLTGIPFSFAFHACDIFQTRILLPEKIRAAAAVVFDCRYTLEYARRLYPRAGSGKYHLIYNGIDPDEFLRSGPPLEKSPPLILSAGRLVPSKGFQYLIEACRLLKAEGRKFQCRVIGDGPLRGSLRRMIRENGLVGEVELSGEMDSRKLSELLVRADVFVMPCFDPGRGTHDAIPTVIIEAQAAGLAVIATDLFGIPEIVKHEVNGLLVPGRDAAAIRGALGRILDNPSWARRLASRARRGAERDLDIRDCAARRVALFRQALPASPPGDLPRPPRRR